MGAAASLAASAALRGFLLAGLLTGIGELAQDLGGIGDARHHFVDAELEQSFSRAAAVFVSAPQPDGDLRVGELAAQAAREVAGVVRGVRRNGGDEERLALLLRHGL